MSVAGLERMTIGSLAKRLTLTPHHYRMSTFHRVHLVIIDYGYVIRIPPSC